MGNSSPAFGMIGTLIGLVQMLTMMDDPSKIGGSMAVAMLTTFYGALLAYLVFLPLADKLGGRARQEVVNREIIIQGLVSILAGRTRAWWSGASLDSSTRNCSRPPVRVTRARPEAAPCPPIVASVSCRGPSPAVRPSGRSPTLT